jgi:amino acid transporter
MHTEKESKRFWYRPKGAWYNIVELAVALAIICPAVMLAAYFGLTRIQSEFCPTNAFLRGPTQIGEIVLMLPWIFVGMMVGFYVMYKVELRIRHVLGAIEQSEFWDRNDTNLACCIAQLLLRITRRPSVAAISVGGTQTV